METPPNSDAPGAPEPPEPRQTQTPNQAPPGTPHPTNEALPRIPKPTSETPPGNASPVFGRTLYDTIVHDILPLITRPKTGIPIITVIIAIGAILFMLRSEGLSYETAWFGFRVGGAQAELQSPALRQCLAEARRLNKPYAIESITYWIQVEKDSLDGKPAQRHTRRIFYTLRSLQPITNNQDLFEEELHTHSKEAAFEHWYGTEKEVFHDSTKQKFKVLFDMQKDDVRTVVTGANFVLPLPFENRTELDEHLTILSNQDFQAYPNELDAICELNMVIESGSLAIQPVGNAAKSYFQGSLKDEDAKLGYDPASGTGVRTLSARWRNVRIGETVGIYFSWPADPPVPAQISER
jgi:hypothetical protein